MKNFTLLLLAFVFQLQFTIGQATSFETAHSKADHLKTLMQHCANCDLFNGVILVAEKGEILYQDALGYADKVTGEELSTDHSFYLASVSKQFTTMGIMILKEQGKLSYDDPLSKFFPEFPAYADNVTIRHMMTHTSGIPDHYGLGLYKPKLSNEDVFNRLIQVEQLDFEPGAKYSYSNGAYVLLSMVVSKVAEMSFSQFMQENVFEPLEMVHTVVFDNDEIKVEKRAKGHDQNGGSDDYEILTTGAGGMFSTVQDLLKWDQGLYTDKIVSKNSLIEAYAPTTLNDGSVSEYGYGWGIQDGNDGKVVSHSGGMNGYRTFIRRDLSNQHVHIILTNYGDGVAMGGINSAIANIMNDKPYELPKPRISTLIAKLMQENEPQIAMTKIGKMLAEDEYNVDEEGVNTLGYQYLNQNKYDEAIAVFQFNIDQFPSSANTYDSMGEAYMLSGDNDKAIEYYKYSVQLNPNNINGISMLEKLGVSTDDLIPKIEISTDLLDTYVGKYELGPGFILTILREGDQMKIHPTGQQVSDIYPISQTKFFSKIVDAQITFNKDERGKVKGLTLHQGGDHEAKRVE